MILIDGDAKEWKRRAWSFGEATKDLIWFMETVDTGVDIAYFPRTLYQGSLEPRRHVPEQKQPNVGGRAHEGDEDGEWGMDWETTQATEKGTTRGEDGRRTCATGCGQPEATTVSGGAEDEKAQPGRQGIRGVECH